MAKLAGGGGVETGIWSPKEAGSLCLSQTTVKNDFCFASGSQELLLELSDVHKSGQGTKKINPQKTFIYTNRLKGCIYKYS